MIGRIKNHGAPLSSNKVVQCLLTHTKNDSFTSAMSTLGYFRCFQNSVNSIFLLLKVKFQLSEFHCFFFKMTGLKLRIQSPHENCKSHIFQNISINEPSIFFCGEGSYPPFQKSFPPKKRAQFYPYRKLTVPFLRSPNLPLFQGTKLPGFRENSFTQRLEIERNMPLIWDLQ